jgi:ammonia channel protein AmtB
MNVGWQALGLAICIVVGLVTAWVLAAVLERTIGLRADEETIVEGFDLHEWDIVHDAPAQIAPNGQAPRSETVAAVGPGDGGP